MRVKGFERDDQEKEIEVVLTLIIGPSKYDKDSFIVSLRAHLPDQENMTTRRNHDDGLVEEIEEMMREEFEIVREFLHEECWGLCFEELDD